MYEPKPYEPGGDKPGDDTPAYGQSGGDTTVECTCEEWPVKVPDETQPFRRLLLALKEALQDLPPDTAKKFEDELKDAEKESQGIPAVVAKYKEFYDKLDSRLSEAKCWKEEIARWLKGKLSQAARDAIEEYRRTNYDDPEKKICCDWLALRDRLNRLRECLEQAKRTEEERKKDYDDFKAFEKELGARLDKLKTLFEQAKALNAEQRYKAVFAVSLEFRDIYNDLGLVRDWANARRECRPGYEEPTKPGGGEYGGGGGSQYGGGGGGGGGGYGGEEPKPTPEYGGGGYGEQPQPEYGGYGEAAGGGLKDQWTPDKFKNRLMRYLRALVLAKYQRFRWQVFFQTQTANAEKGEKDCKAFRDERQKQFIDEADDIPTPESQGGGEGGEQPSTGGYTEEPSTGGYPQEQPTGGYPGKPPTGGYTERPPTGGYPETPPAGEGYEQKPPAGNYPDKPTHPPSDEYKDTPVKQPDTYQGRQKK
ncbi:MAG TPA: hypothetical protein VD861_07830 [Pyrinomonadaceae bacterium]|nr:hypothetical protein [Pyrinomonadaceae bacterium]